MHFSKVFALASLAVVATGLPNPPPTVVINEFKCAAPNTVAKCCGEQKLDASNDEHVRRLKDVLSNNGLASGLVSAVIGGLPIGASVPI